MTGRQIRKLLPNGPEHARLRDYGGGESKERSLQLFGAEPELGHFQYRVAQTYRVFELREE